MSILEQSVSSLISSLENKQISATELTQTFLEQIKKYDAKLNSFVTVCDEQALAMAAKVDNDRQAGKPLNKMAGIPYAHKDIFCTKGIKTSCGSKMLDNFIAPYDAHVSERFNQAQMIMLGKTNMDEFAMGSSNETSYYGAVKNPWQLECVPGGSSGGSSAAVAARLAPLATGTDTGGSIRQPAALTGITGIKPTYGVVSRWGMIAFASSLDQGGPMARSAQDCAFMLNAMAGFDERDSTSLNAIPPDYTEQLDNDITGLKIGIAKEHFEGLDSAIAQVIQKTAKELEQLGATLVDISLPNTAMSVPAYYVIAPAECSSNLARYDGVRYGYRCDDPKDLTDLYARTRQQGFGSEVKRRVMVGTYALSAGYYDAYYLKAQKIRQLIADDFKKAYEQVDVILTPTAPTTAFKLGEKSDPISMYLSDINTIAVNLAGLPALSMPAGFVNNMPVGAQLIGNYLCEAQLLNVAHRYQSVTDWHTQKPALISS